MATPSDVVEIVERAELARCWRCRGPWAGPASRTPRTSTPLEVLAPLASAWPSTSGTADDDAGHRGDPVGDRRRSRSAGESIGCTMRWPLRPRILSMSSARKPFITAMTMISVATPSMMPRNEKPAMTEMKASRRRGAQIARRRSSTRSGRTAGSDRHGCHRRRLRRLACGRSATRAGNEPVDCSHRAQRLAFAGRAPLHLDLAALRLPSGRR